MVSLIMSEEIRRNTTFTGYIIKIQTMYIVS